MPLSVRTSRLPIVEASTKRNVVEAAYEDPHQFLNTRRLEVLESDAPPQTNPNLVVGSGLLAIWQEESKYLNPESAYRFATDITFDMLLKQSLRDIRRRIFSGVSTVNAVKRTFDKQSVPVLGTTPVVSNQVFFKSRAKIAKHYGKGLSKGRRLLSLLHDQTIIENYNLTDYEGHVAKHLTGSMIPFDVAGLAVAITLESIEQQNLKDYDREMIDEMSRLPTYSRNKQ